MWDGRTEVLTIFAFFLFFSETVTVSVFVLSGDTLRATVKASGPVAPSDVESGMELQQAITKFDRNPNKLEDAIHEKETADFEDLAIYPEYIPATNCFSVK